MAYTTAASFLAAYDTRRVGQLLSDTGTPETDPATSATLTQILAEASELVQASALIGKRYTTDDLTTLADVNNASPTTGFLLRRLVNDIAFGLLVSRRGPAAADVGRLAPRYVEALTVHLPALRNGEMILGITGTDDLHPDAGLPALVNLDPSVNANSPQDLLSSNLRLFPKVSSGPGYCSFGGGSF